ARDRDRDDGGVRRQPLDDESYRRAGPVERLDPTARPRIDGPGEPELVERGREELGLIIDEGRFRPGVELPHGAGRGEDRGAPRVVTERHGDGVVLKDLRRDAVDRHDAGWGAEAEAVLGPDEDGTARLRVD